MIDAFLYRIDTGAILQRMSGATPEDFQVPDGYALALVVDDVSDETHYVSGGVFQPYPPRPTAAAEWNGSAWVDERGLAGAKADRWELMKRAREVAISSPLETAAFGTFDADERSRANITDAVLMMTTLAALGVEQTIDFTRADDTVATLTAADMVQVGLALGVQVQAAHATARLRRAAIEEATSVEEVAAVVW